MTKALDFVDSFEKAAKIIADNGPKDITYCIFVYARNPEDKSEKFPDGDFWFKGLDRTTYYDRATIEQYIKEYWRTDR